jgi:hypothetical protein
MFRVSHLRDFHNRIDSAAPAAHWRLNDFVLPGAGRLTCLVLSFAVAFSRFGTHRGAAVLLMQARQELVVVVGPGWMC